MPLKQSYVIWNNKGGVGKTTLTFHMASQYAINNPDETVLVIDLCPQANVSMALLSSTTIHGSKRLSEIYQQQKTVSYYLDRVTQPAAGLNACLLPPKQYLTHVYDYNKNMPGNLELLCGDMHLELVGRALEHRRSGIDTPGYSPWVNITSCMRNFINAVTSVGDGSGSLHPWVVFIDTNPAFSVYTEIALLAAQRLIIPINADDFSKEAVAKMLDLVYGIVPEGEANDFRAYRAYMFSSKVGQYQLRKPLIHLVVNNRTTVYGTRSAKAFAATADQIASLLYDAYQKYGVKVFTPKRTSGLEGISLDDFVLQLIVNAQDFHSTAVSAAHIGCPLSELPSHVYVFDERVKIDKAGLTNYVTRLNELVTRL